MTAPKSALGLRTIVNLIIASMVGTGVFTSSGFLMGDIGSKPAVLLGWLLGGLLALCGGLAYAELGAAFPGNGGEYQLLTRIYHPAVGFLAGLTSFIIGFSAPVAAYAIAVATFLGTLIPALPVTFTALVLVVAMSVMHSQKTDTSAKWQDALTFGKLALIAVLCLAGFLPHEHVFNEPSAMPLGTAVLSKPFAQGLIWISFAYSGWNAASYVAGEVKDPAKTLPRAVIIGTLVVTCLYVWLNWVFLDAAPTSEIAGKLEVAEIAARHLFGDSASRIVGAVVALGLLSTMGAMIMTGPRVLEAIGDDYPRLHAVATRTTGYGPMKAVGVQGVVAAIMVLTASFDTLVDAVGLVLSIWCLLTVLGVIVLRVREPGLYRPYKTFLYPVTPLLFIALSVWMIGYRLVGEPALLVKGAVAVLICVPLYFWGRRPA